VTLPIQSAAHQPGARNHVAARSVRAGVAVAVTLAVVFVGAVPARADGTRRDEWYLSTLQVTQAQRITKGAGVVVAVVDQGVSTEHPDLKGAVLAGRDTVAQKNDGHFDPDGHGTAMAGIIAARGRGGSGLLGLAPEAKILPVRPSNDTYFAAEGIRWAASHGAKVINMSFAIGGSENLQAAVKEAAVADVVLVGAVGNTGDKGNALEYPVAYPEVLGVGAVDRTGKVPGFSQHGPQVDIVAPGTDIPSLYLGNDYRTGRGTSDAAAIVSGAAALVRAKYPDLSAAEVVQRLTETAIDKGDRGRDDYYGNGQLDLVAALTAPQPATSSAPAVTHAPAAAPAAAADEGHRGGIPPLAIIAAGVVILAGAVLAVIFAIRRSSNPR
jgi:type VII secretion-associated serine protease mycosin